MPLEIRVIRASPPDFEPPGKSRMIGRMLRTIARRTWIAILASICLLPAPALIAAPSSASAMPGAPIVLSGTIGAAFVFSRGAPRGVPIAIPDNVQTIKPIRNFWDPAWSGAQKRDAFPKLVQAVNGIPSTGAQLAKLRQLITDPDTYDHDQDMEYMVGGHDVGVLLLDGGTLQIVAFANNLGCVNLCIDGRSKDLLLLSHSGAKRIRAWFREVGISPRAF